MVCVQGGGWFLRICTLACHVISKLLHHYACACESMLWHANTYREPSESLQNKKLFYYRFSGRLCRHFWCILSAAQEE